MTNEEIRWELKRVLDAMIERKIEKFGESYPWRKYHGLDVSDSYELGYIQAAAFALQMLDGFDPEVVNTSQRRRPILSATVEAI